MKLTQFESAYLNLLVEIRKARKGSVGAIENVYLPQLDRRGIDKAYDELAGYVIQIDLSIRRGFDGE
jgi:hypothetical protein